MKVIGYERSWDHPMYYAFIDFAKAFNSVYRQGLWYKLIKIGCTGKMLRIIRSLYSKVRYSVRGHHGTTELFLTMLGLQQGAILSPYLFAFFVNDLVDTILEYFTDGIGIQVEGYNIPLLMYADDMILMSDSSQGLQELLDVFHDYCSKWKLKVNLNKSSVLVCNRNIRQCNIVFFYGADLLETCEFYNYLGVTFTSRGINNVSLQVLCNQAKKSLGVLSTRLCNMGSFPPHVCLRLIHVSINPILCYASEVWGYMEAGPHQVVLNKWCKRILGVKDTTANCAVLGELGQFPLFINRRVNMLRYWFKIISGAHTRYRYIVYSFLRSHINVRLPGSFRNWALEVKNILISIGQEHVWQSESIDVDIRVFINHVQCTLVDLYVNEWQRHESKRETLYL
jgi:hypothetical protein